MKRWTTSVLLFLLINNFSAAQDRKSNHIFIELAGNAVGLSVNYEKVVADDWSIRGGIGFIPGTPSSSVVFPILVNKRIYVGKDYFEFGAGGTIFLAKLEFGNNKDLKANFIIPTGLIGFCYHMSDDATGRLAFTPFTDGKNFLPFFGISFGYSF